MDEDERVITSLGYKQEFKREFSLWTTFGVSFSVLGLLPSFASTICRDGMGLDSRHGLYPMRGLEYRGTVFVDAYKVCPVCAFKRRMGVIINRVSGGLYYTAAVLAPDGWGPLAAWVTGWSSWLSQVMGAPSVNYGTAGMILAAGSIYNPGYVPKHYHTFLLTTCIMIIHGMMTSLPTKWIARVSSYGSAFNLLALITVLIAIPAGTTNSPRFNSSADVWKKVYKGTSYPDGVAVLMSFVSVIWTMSGYDSPFHLTEECSNANIAAPRAIVLTSTFGGIAGWLLQVAVAYTVKDIREVMESDLSQPWASFLFQVMPRKIAVAILALTIICGFSMGHGCMIAASRVTYAYARDGCFPYSDVWKKVNQRTTTPVNAVWINCAIGILATLLIFAGELAMGALFSIGAIASFVAFAIPIAIRVFVVKEKFRPGPWSLGRYSPIIGMLGVAFVVLMLPILCLPTYTGSKLTPANMNWTAVVYGGPMLGVLIWWVVDARKWFKGPRVNLDHHMLDRARGDPNDEKGIVKAAAEEEESV
ncbi:GABA/polyamine transporter [Ophidiomyces ophidiicola]|nr:GABA/polyamine transporter [Ophidiomyces ophidiicola]